MNLVLGPLLGLEGEYKYSVCFLVPNTQSAAYRLVYSIGGQRQSIDMPDRTVQLVNNIFVRFSFSVPEAIEEYKVSYQIFSEEKVVNDTNQRESWTFTVAAQDQVPNIGFASCNGDSTSHPKGAKPESFALWDKMKNVHEDVKPLHLLIMGGDQLYADSLWDEVPFLKKLKKWKFIIKNKKLKASEVKGFEHELRIFYEQLYISSWSNQSMSYVMSSSPTIMMWDDHDIVDGWGSYDEDFQKSQIMQSIFKVASEYFDLFQARTSKNMARISSHDYSQRITYRNSEIFVLDNRSHRTETTIMDDQQWKNLEHELAKPMFTRLHEKISEEKQLLFVVPVPIAHLDYFGVAENFFKLIGNIFFRISLHDDALDHWDHAAHKEELKKLLDLSFDYARRNSADYLTFISGDVHTGGGATISGGQFDKYATQLISSGVVHSPPSKFLSFAMKSISRDKLSHAGYSLEFKDFGNYNESVVRKRNFGILFHDSRMNSALYTLEDNKPFYRALKLFN